LETIDLNEDSEVVDIEYKKHSLRGTAINMTLRSYLQNLFSKILTLFYDRYFHNSTITYSGSYSNFNEVIQEFGIKNEYSNQEQFNLSVNLAKKFFLNSEIGTYVNVGWASQRLNFLPNFLAAL
jgi:hypothetical protein